MSITGRQTGWRSTIRSSSLMQYDFVINGIYALRSQHDAWEQFWDISFLADWRSKQIQESTHGCGGISNIGLNLSGVQPLPQAIINERGPTWGLRFADLLPNWHIIWGEKMERPKDFELLDVDIDKCPLHEDDQCTIADAQCNGNERRCPLIT